MPVDLQGSLGVFLAFQRSATTCRLPKVTPGGPPVGKVCPIAAFFRSPNPRATAAPSCRRDRSRSVGFLDPEPGEDDALLAADPRSRPSPAEPRALDEDDEDGEEEEDEDCGDEEDEGYYYDDGGHALDGFGGVLSAGEAQELAVALSAPELALPGLLSFFAGPRVAALAASPRLAAVVRQWLLMPLAWGPSDRPPALPPHISGDFAALVDAALYAPPVATAAPAAAAETPSDADSAAASSDSDSDEGGDDEAREGAAADPPSPAAAQWLRELRARLGPLASIPVRPEERAHLGSPGGALLGHLLAAPASILGPVEAIVAAAVRRAAGRDHDSPYARLLTFVAHLAAALDTFCAEADALLCERAAARDDGAPPLASLRAGWATLRSTVDSALLPALASCAAGAAGDRQVDLAASYHAAAAAALAGAPTARLLGLPLGADLGPLRAALCHGASPAPLLRLAPAIRLALTCAPAASPPAALLKFGPAALAFISAVPSTSCTSWRGAVGALDSAVRLWQRTRLLLCAWLEALRSGASSEPAAFDAALSEAVDRCGGLGWEPEDVRAARWRPCGGVRELARVVLERPPGDEGRGDAYHLVKFAGGGTSMRCALTGAFEAGSDDFLRVYAGDDVLGVPVHEGSAASTRLSADFVVPGRVAMVHFHHGHGAGRAAASWFSAVFSAPVDAAALEQLSALTWASLQDRAGGAASGGPMLPPAVLPDASPPAWLVERALASCANDAEAAGAWLLQHVASLDEAGVREVGSPSDAHAEAGLYEASSPSGTLRVDLHLATVLSAGASSAGVVGDNFRTLVHDDSSCTEVVWDGTACEARDKSAAAAESARLTTSEEGE